MANRGRPRHPDVLTPREWEVLALIREGLTNREIADRLSLSADTAKTHVSSILSKLGVSTREEAAAWQPDATREPRRWRLALWAKVGLGAAAVGMLAALAFLGWGLMQSEATDEPLTGANLLAVKYEAGNDRSGIALVDVDSGDRFDFSSATELDGSFGFSGWSPDGEWIAFTFTAEDDREVARFGLYAARLDGTDVTHLDDVGFSDDIPQCSDGEWLSWSPLSDRVAYADHGGRITTVGLNGSKQELAVGYSPSWSPNGRLLVYQYEANRLGVDAANSGPCNVAIADVDTGALVKVVGSGVNASWSRIGDAVLYSNDGNLVQWHLDSGSEEIVVQNPPSFSSLSPEGDRLLIADCEMGVIIMDVSTEVMVPVGDGCAAMWSPDGRRIAITGSGSTVSVAESDGSWDVTYLTEGRALIWKPTDSLAAAD